MKRPLFSRPLSLALALTAAPLLSFAADHGDVPAAGNDPTADITDLYAWMSPDASTARVFLPAASPDPYKFFRNSLACSI